MSIYSLIVSQYVSLCLIMSHHRWFMRLLGLLHLFLLSSLSATLIHLIRMTFPASNILASTFTNSTSPFFGMLPLDRHVCFLVIADGDSLTRQAPGQRPSRLPRREVSMRSFLVDCMCERRPAQRHTKADRNTWPRTGISTVCGQTQLVVVVVVVLVLVLSFVRSSCSFVRSFVRVLVVCLFVLLLFLLRWLW